MLSVLSLVIFAPARLILALFGDCKAFRVSSWLAGSILIPLVRFKVGSRKL